jgi:hypothetical protein
MTMTAGRLEAERFPHPVKEFGTGLLSNADRPVSLHVGVAADWTDPGTWTADIAA